MRSGYKQSSLAARFIFPICQVYQKKKLKVTMEETLTLQLQVVLMPLLIIEANTFFASKVK